MILRVKQYDEAVLRRSGIPVVYFDDDLRSLADDMFETMGNGCGTDHAVSKVNYSIPFICFEGAG